MPQWTAKKLADAVASQMQLAVGQAYETSVIIPYLNRAYEEVWCYDDWPSLTVVDSMTLANASQTIVLPKKYARLLYNIASTNNTGSIWYDTLQKQLVSLLRMGRIRWLQEYDPAYNCAFLGEQAVKSQPAANGTLKVKSTSSADTSKKVLIEGELDGEYVREVVTTNASNGTTAVTTSAQFDFITGFSKDGTTTGSILLLDGATGATEYGRIDFFANNAYYAAYQLDQLLTAEATIYLIASKRFLPFTNELSTPFMDKIAAPLVDLTTDLCMAEMRQQDYAGYFRQRGLQRLNAVKGDQSEPMEGPIGRA